MRIEFKVPSVPVAQPRQRHRVAFVKGKPMAMSYTPAKDPVNSFKAAVQMACQAAYRGPVIEGAVTFRMTAVFPRPTNKIWKTRPMPREPKLSKPDGDNLQKSVQDALNGVLWRDDSQVWDGGCVKVIAAGNEQPHVLVVIDVQE